MVMVHVKSVTQDGTTALVLFYASESLLRQISRWADEHGGNSPRLASASSAGGVAAALADQATVIIDATSCPTEAMAALRQAEAVLGRDQLAVYTERMHAGLELAVRMHGVIFLLGAMTMTEWDDFFRVRPAMNRRACRTKTG